MQKTKKPMTIIVLISLKTDTNKYMTLDRAATFSPRKSYYIIPLNNT